MGGLTLVLGGLNGAQGPSKAEAAGDREKKAGVRWMHLGDGGGSPGQRARAAPGSRMRQEAFPGATGRKQLPTPRLQPSETSSGF